jgi:hypothetical protein
MRSLAEKALLEFFAILASVNNKTTDNPKICGSRFAAQQTVYVHRGILTKTAILIQSHLLSYFYINDLIDVHLMVPCFGNQRACGLGILAVEDPAR